MTDLATELQHLASVAAVRTRRRVAETDPLLLDQVYSCTSPLQQQQQQQQQSSPLDTPNSSSPAAKAATCVQPAAQSGSSFTSGAASLNSLAALAAYRRQIYLGLDPSTAASRPVSAAASSPAQAAAGSRRSFALKSRPNGMSSPDFGSGHVPGLLPRPDPQDTAAPCTPAQSGMGPLVPPRLYQRSCCPPLCAEPLTAPADDGPGIVAARIADRELLALGGNQQLINRLVYDSLQPAVAINTPPADVTATDCRSAACMGSNSCGAADSADSADSAGSAGSSSSGNQAAAGSLDGQAAVDCSSYAPGLAPWYTLAGPQDTTLVFESRFESGNLRRAVQVTPFEYDLVLQPDINTRGHTQWFFFAVSNTRAGQAYRFNIINLLKEDSTYNMGMLPLMHSERNMRTTGVGWVRCGSQVAYGANSIVCRKKQTYFTLTFTLEFPHSRDLVHLAHCYPFTWTDQQNHIYALKKSPAPHTVLQHTSLATSLAGNAVDLLTITAAADRGKPLAQRQGVVLSARVHPGETNSSFMMKGALQQLLADTAEAAQLRETFVFKVVPMLNPDGVIAGNYRCSLAGLDLNRVYQVPDARLQPVIAAFKEMVRAFTQEREVVLSCDMHGHSRRFGVFMYGCEQKPGKDASPVGPGCPLPGSLGGLPSVPARHQERVFPLMLALNAPDLFSYRSCNFKVQKSKSGTGRVVGFRELGLVNAFTLEASFAGAAVGKYAKQHFNAGHLEEMGAAVVRTLLDYWAPPELNSAPELCSQLDAALLQGLGDSSSAGRSGSGTAAAAAAAAGAAGAAVVVDSAFERLLGVGEAGEDGEDVCTDSDDDSSEDEKPAAGRAASRPAAGSGSLGAAGAAARGPGAATTDRDGAAASGGSSTVASLADIGRQLTDLLSSKLTAAAGVDGSGKAAGQRSAPAGSSAAAAGAVRSLLEAIKASETASSSTAAPAAAGASSSSTDKVKAAAAQGPAGAGSSTVAGAGGASSSSSSSSKAAPDATQNVAAAAQQLLQKLAVAKAKVQAAAAPSAAPVLGPPTAVLAAAGPSDAARSSSTAAGSSSLPSTPAAAAACQPSTCHAPAASAAAVVVAGAGLPAAGVTGATTTAAEGAAAGALTEEEAALLVLPGLSELLQQLVLQTAQLKVKSAAAAKKKGRRKGRWGNPEVLRAARAMADAGLAAALPELGITTRDASGPAAGDSVGWWDDGDSCSSSSSLSTPATPSAPDAHGSLPSAGRRARTAGSRSGKGPALDVERYAYCLEVHKRVAGGVLGASSTDSERAWEEGTAATASCSPSGTGALLSGSGSVGRKAVVFADSQPDALEAGAAAEAGSRPPGGAQAMRRSKSAYPWLDQPTG